MSKTTVYNGFNVSVPTWLREKESNQRPPAYGAGELPLLYPAILNQSVLFVNQYAVILLTSSIAENALFTFV